MNTAAGLFTASPLQAALQMPADPAAPAAAGGDFTAALAAACAAEPEADMPEGMQSAAALAWLAGFMSPVLPTQPQAGASMLDDSSQTPAVDLQNNADVVPDAALAFLQGMLAPVVSRLPHSADADSVAEPGVESAAQPGVAAAAALAAGAGVAAVAVPAAEPGVVAAAVSAAATAPTGVADVVRTVLRTAQSDTNKTPISISGSPDLEAAPAGSDAAAGSTSTAGATAAVVHGAAPVAVPLAALMRAMNTDARPQAPVSVQGDDGTQVLMPVDSAATNEAPAESSVGKRLVGALAELASLRADGPGNYADTDRNTTSGPNLYVSTREAVASVAGAVSNRPEVVHSTVGSPRWANELGSRLAMMSVRGQQEGSLSLTPEHLGPLEVRISVSQDTTSVWFGAQHADTRAALADALPRLREMFAESGLALGHAGVSHEMPGQEARREEASAFRVAAGPEPTESSPVAVTRISSGLLDTWA